MLDFSSALFWYKFMFVTELAIAEALTTYTLAKRKISDSAAVRNYLLHLFERP